MADEYDEYDNISISFFLNAHASENIPTTCEWCKEMWTPIPSMFVVESPDYYNCKNIPFVFHISTGIIGDVVKNILVVFSIALPAQDFSSYIMQKTYSVTSEINGKTDLELSDWNVSPNKKWYVSVKGLDVALFDTETDMLADTNPIAIGIADPISLEVVLTYVDEYEGDMEFYYEDVSIHLVLSSDLFDEYDEYDEYQDEYEDLYRYFCVKPFTDMSEIRHPIYNNSNLVLSRGEAELNLHTFTVLGRELTLGTHIPEMEAGEIVDLTSVRRGVSEKSQILSQTINGEMSDDGTASLINAIKVANYTELYRQ